MPRRLRVQFEGAIYHAMSRGNARQDIVLDDRDRQHFLELLGAQVGRSGWELISFVLLSNHFHLLVRTPRPDLAAGMQRLLSAHARYFAARHRRPGHLFQGRYTAELIEDEAYYWSVSRYIHLNPVRAGLARVPEDWPWSSYPGYADDTRRLAWVAYERLWQAWRGDFGGDDATAHEAYRRFVAAGVERPPETPFAAMRHGWVLGSPAFEARLKAALPTAPTPRATRHARALLRGRPELAWPEVLRQVCDHYALSPSDLTGTRRHARARAVAAWLGRRYTTVRLGELSRQLGYARPQCIAGILRRLDDARSRDPAISRDLDALEHRLRPPPDPAQAAGPAVEACAAESQGGNKTGETGALGNLYL
jgi:putative transposase